MKNSHLYLMHYGTLNMKWGIRNYQNKDGSLTPEGRLRYGNKLNGGMTAEEQNYVIKKAYNQDIARSAGKQADLMKATNTTTDNVANVSKNIRTIFQNSIDEHTTTQKVRIFGEEPSSYTDAELKAIINRLSLEQNYNKLTTTDVIVKDEVALGKEKAQENLKKFETGLGLLGSAVATAAGIATIVSIARRN